VVPYTSGNRSPTRGITPHSIPASDVPGFWPYGWLWAYPFNYPYYCYHNGHNTTANVTCLCQHYSECGCDPNNNETFIQVVVNNGTNAPVNTSMSQFVTWPNGTRMVYINGTLPNGTTASGGTDPSNADEISGAAKLMLIPLSLSWVMAATVAAILTN
jgi:hypothetical protein